MNTFSALFSCFLQFPEKSPWYARLDIMIQRKHTMKSSVAWNMQNDLENIPTTEPTSSTLKAYQPPEQVQEDMAKKLSITMFSYLWHQWQHVILGDDASSVNHERLAVDCFLRGLALLLNLAGGPTPCDDSTEFLALIELLNNIALCSLSPSFIQKSSTQDRLSACFMPSLPERVGVQFLQNVLEALCQKCTVSVVHLIFAMFIVNNSLLVAEQQLGTSDPFNWHTLVTNLNWTYEDVNGSAFLHALATDFDLGYFRDAVRTDQCPVLALIRKLFPSGHEYHPSSTESMWSLARTNNLDNQSIEEIFKHVQDKMFHGCNSDISDVLLMATYHLVAGALCTILKWPSIKDGGSKLHHVSQKIDDQHTRANEAWLVIRRTLYLIGLEEFDQLFDELLQSVLETITSPESDANRTLHWSCKQIARAIVDERLSMPREVNDDLIRKMAQLIDLLISDTTMQPPLHHTIPALLDSLTHIVHGQPNELVNVLKTSSKLCYLQDGTRSPPLLIPLIQHGLPFEPVKSAMDCVEQAVAVLFGLPSTEGNISTGCAVIIFWWAYCKWFEKNVSGMPQADRMAALKLLESYAKTHENKDQPTLACILAAILISTMLDVLDLNPRTAFRHSSVLAPLFNLCVCAQQGLNRTNSLPRSVLSSFSRLQDELAALSKKLISMNYTKAEWEMFNGSIANINDLLVSLRLEIVSPLTHFDSIEENYDVCVSMQKWLAERRVPGTQDHLTKLLKARENPMSTLHDLQTAMSTANEATSDRLQRDVNSKVKVKVSLYIAQTAAGSKLCKYISGTLLLEDMTEGNWPERVSEHVRAIFKRVEALLDPNSLYSELLSVVRGVEDAEPRSLPMLYQEAGILLYSDAHKSQYEGIQRLERLLHLLSIRSGDGLGGLVSALQRSQVSSEDAELQFLRETVDWIGRVNADKVLSTMDDMTKKAYETVKGLQPWHWDFFRLVSSRSGCPRVFDFFKRVSTTDEDFTERMAIANTRLEGDPQRGMWLQNVLNIRPFMDVFFNESATAGDIISSLTAITPPIDVSVFRSAMDNLDEIKNLLDSIMESAFDRAKENLEGLTGGGSQAKAFIRQDKKTGVTCQCTFALPRREDSARPAQDSHGPGCTPSEDHQVNGKPRKLCQADLDELRLCLPYFYEGTAGTGDINGANVKTPSALKTRAVKLSSTLHSLFQLCRTVKDLEASGDHLFLSSHLPEEGFEFNDAEIMKYQKAAEGHHDNWKRQLAELRRTCPSLEIFSNIDVGKLLEISGKLSTSVALGQSGTGVVEDIYKFLGYIVSVRGLVSLANDISPEVVNRVLAGMRPSQGGVQLLQVLLKKFMPSGSDPQTSTCSGSSQVMCCMESDTSPTNALVAVLCSKFRDTHICHSQFLFCSKKTTTYAVKGFFKAVHACPTKKFVICGVDALPSKCQIVAMSYQAAITRGNRSGCVYYLFYDRKSLECWPKKDGLHEESLPVATLDDLEECFHSQQQYSDSEANQLSVMVVSGKAGIGKSHFIHQQCRQQCRQHAHQQCCKHCLPVVVSLTEHYSREDLCRRLSSAILPCADGALPSIFFQIGENIDVDDVNKIFFKLLWCHCIFHSERKEIFSIIPGLTTHWQWYVELPDVKNAGNLPILFKATQSHTEVTFLNHPLHLDDRKRMLAKLLQVSMCSSLGRPECNVIDKDTVIEYEACHNDDQCYELMDKVIQRLGDSRGNRVQELFALDYVYEKWSTQKERAMFRYYCGYFRNYSQLVFQQLLDEAVFMATNKNVCNFYDCQQSFIIFDPEDGVRFLTSRPESLRSLPRLEQRGAPPGTSKPFVELDNEWCGAGGAAERLAWAFGMSKDSLSEVLLHHEFVLTQDFAFKLIMIHERMKVGKPVILEGETGAGKTFLLKAYTSLLNFQAAHNPELPEATRISVRFHHWLLDLVFEHRIWDDMHPDMRVQFSGTADDDFHPKKRFNELDMGLEHILQREESTVAELISIWGHILGSVPSLRKKRMKELLQNRVKKWLHELLLLEPVHPDLSSLLEMGHDVMSDDDSRELIDRWLATKERSLFHKLLVHPGLTKGDTEIFIRKVSTIAEGMREFKQVVFFDEVNTSSCIGVFKELFLHKAIDGVELPAARKMFFVAAINPYRTRTEQSELTPRERNEQWDTNFFGQTDSRVYSESWQRELGQEYLVHALPKSMDHFKWKYTCLGNKDEKKEYIKDKIKFLERDTSLSIEGQAVNFATNSAELELLSQCLHYAHNYCCKYVGKSFVSQRDIQRVFRLIPHFWKVELYKRRKDIRKDIHELLHCSIIQAIAMVFYLRLPLKPSDRFTGYKDGVCRADFDRYVSKHVAKKLQYRSRQYASVAKELDACIKEFVTRDHFTIPDGIALTMALRENIYATVACIQQGIPLGIIGEPGSSKTLSYHIVCKNMRGDNSGTEFCREFVAVDSFFCQCSPDSTTDQIQSIFKGAITRQGYHVNYERRQINAEELQQSAASGTASSFVLHNTGRQGAEEAAQEWPRHTHVTVFIDEAGLPDMKKNRMVMKVLHQYLDNPAVAFVALSNHWFDAANTNRMLTVFRSHASEDDLVTLAYGCLGHQQAPGSDVDKFLCGICKAYKIVVDRHPKWFHQRDLISLFRSLKRKELSRNSMNISVTASDLLDVVEENFGGLGSEEEQRKVIRDFLDQVRYHYPAFIGFEELQYPRNPVKILLSMQRQAKESAQPDVFRTTSPLVPRFQLLIDEYDCDHGLVDVLFHIRVLDGTPGSTVVFKLASFTGDDLELQCTTVLAKIRQLLSTPRTLVIMSSPKLHGYLYELLNQSYRTVTAEGKQCAFSSIAMQDSTFPCQVHPDFRCIVVLNRALATKERTPFLSRFAKFAIHPRHAIDYLSGLVRPDQILDQFHGKVKDFVNHIGRSRFIGCGQDERLSGNLATIVLSQVTHRDDGTFAVRSSSRPQEAVENAVRSLFAILPLDAFVSVREYLEPTEIYDGLYLIAHQNFTLSRLLKTRPVGGDGTMKVLATTTSPFQNFQQLCEPATARLCLGENLAYEVEVHRCGEEHFATVQGAEQSLMCFLRSDNKKCCVLFADISEKAFGSTGIAVLKQLIDEQCALWKSPGKIVIMVLFSPWEFSWRAFNSCAFLNDWESRCVSVPELEFLCPLSITDLSPLIGMSPGITHQYMADIERIIAQWMEERVGMLSHYIAQLCSADGSFQSLAGKQRRTILESMFRHQSDDDLGGAILRIFKMVPSIFAWIAKALARWIKLEVPRITRAAVKQTAAGNQTAHLVDNIMAQQGHHLMKLLEYILSVVVGGSNLDSIISSRVSHNSLSSLVMLVPEDSSHQLEGESGVLSPKTPFFHHIMDYVQSVASRCAVCDLTTLHSTLLEDKQFAKLLRDKESSKLAELYAKDLVAYSCSWKGGEPALDLAWKCLKEIHDGCEDSTDMLPFVHLKVIDSRPEFLALLSTIQVQISLPGLHDTDLSDLEDDIDTDDMVSLLTGAFKKATGRLWDFLINSLKELDSGNVESMRNGLTNIRTWRAHYYRMMLYWPHATSTEKRTPVQEAFCSTQRQGLSKQTRLLAASDIILGSFSAEREGGFLPLLKKFLWAFLSGDQTQVKEGDVRMKDIVDEILNLASSHAAKPDIIRLRLLFIRWLLIPVSEAKPQDYEVELAGGWAFASILQCLSYLKKEGCAITEQEPRVPEELSTFVLLALRDTLVGSPQPSRQSIDQIQNGIEKGINRYLVDEVRVPNVEFSGVKYYPALFNPSDFPHYVGDLQHSNPAFSTTLLQSLHRVACQWQRRRSVELAVILDNARLSSVVYLRDQASSVPRVVMQSANIRVAFECAAADICDRMKNRVDFASAPAKIELDNSVDTLLKDHCEHYPWLEYFLWCLVKKASPSSFSRFILLVSQSGKIESLTEKWRAFAVFRSSREIRGDSAGHFLGFRDLNLIREYQEDMAHTIGEAQSAAAPARMLQWFIQKCESGSAQKTQSAEACIFLKLSLELFYDPDFLSYKSLSAERRSSELLKRALIRIFGVKEKEIETPFSRLMRSDAEDDLDVRDILLETMAAVLGCKHRNNYLQAYVDNPRDTEASFVVGAMSQRAALFSDLTKFDDFFQMTQNGLPRFAELQEGPQQKSPLSLLGYVLMAVHTYSALCWHALLYPSVESLLSVFTYPDGVISLETMQQYCVHQCIDRIRHFYQYLSSADMNVVLLSRKLLVLTSLQCYASSSWSPAGYQMGNDRCATELYFEQHICQPSLAHQSADVSRYLKEKIGDRFAEMYHLQLPQGRKLENIVWSLAAARHHPILAEVLANRSLYTVLHHGVEVMLFYLNVQKRLSGCWTFAELTADGPSSQLTLRKSFDRAAGDGSTLRSFNEKLIQHRVKMITKALATVYGNNRPGWISSPEGVDISLESKLIDLVDFGGRPPVQPVLYCLIKELVSWNSRLFEICESELRNASPTSDLFCCLERCLQRDHITVKDMSYSECKWLLKLDDKTFGELMALHCRAKFNKYWKVDVNLDDMQQDIILQVISSMKRIKVKPRDLALRFKQGLPRDREANLAWSVMAEEELDHAQKSLVTQTLANLTEAEVRQFINTLEQTMDGLLQPEFVPNRTETNLHNLLTFEPASQCGVPDSVSLELKARNLVPLLRIVKQHQATVCAFAAVPASLQVDMDADDAGDAEELLQFGRSAGNLEHLEQIHVYLLESVSRLEENPTTRIASLLLGEEHQARCPDLATEEQTDISEQPPAERFVAALRPGVLGHHCMALLRLVSRYLKQCRAQALSVFRDGRGPANPCQLSHDGNGVQDVAVELTIHVQQHRGGIEGKIIVTKMPTEMITEALAEAILQVRGKEKRILEFSIGDEVFDDPADLEREIQTFFGQNTTTAMLEVTVIHTK